MDRETVGGGPEGATGVASPVAFVRPARRHAFGALREPGYQRYFYGQVASVSGTFLQSTALGWLVLQLMGSVSALGLVLAAGALPTLVLGVWGGALVDRWDLRRLLITTQISRIRSWARSRRSKSSGRSSQQPYRYTGSLV